MLNHKQAFSPNLNTWRDQQINGFVGSGPGALLAQEKIMLDFLGKYPDVSWRWKAEKTSFYKTCCSLFDIDSRVDYNGIIVFGIELGGLSTRSMAAKISNLVQNVKVAYVGINRYSISHHDMNLELPDSIADSLDMIMNYCDPSFKRLHTYDHVDGDHMVGAHPMDCYVLCR